MNNITLIRDVKILEDKDRYFADVDEMVRWINQPSIVPFLQNVPDEVRMVQECEFLYVEEVDNDKSVTTILLMKLYSEWMVL